MKTDITELKRSLADQAETVCRFLLPDGKRIGSEWVHDPGQGKIKVMLNGNKAGVWSHFGGTGGGDLIDLWMQEQGQTVRECLDDVCEYLGVERTKEPDHKKEREYVAPIPPKFDARTTSPAWKYLTETRKIPANCLEAYRIGVLPNDTHIVFPFMSPDGEAKLFKKREGIDGAPSKPTEAGCQPTLMGWHLVAKNRSICIVEGELDAPSGMAYLQGTSWEMPVLSVPFGGGSGDKQQWVDTDWEALEAVETIYLALDSDAEGETACEAIAGRVGRHKCHRVILPKKDFNDCLKSDVKAGEILMAFDAAETLDPVSLRKANTYMDDMRKIFYPTPDEHIGYSTPFEHMGGGKLLFRGGETTIWSGDTGTGKSQVVSYCCPHWVKQGSVIVMSSLEMKGARSVARLVRQTTGMEKPAVEYMKRSLDWLSGENDSGGEFMLYDFVGKADIYDILEVFTYARMRYGADQFIIDSLMRLGLSPDDYNGQEAATFAIVNWAIEHDVHVHLVAHNRKPQVEGQHAGTSGVKGAMEVGANAANHMEVVRYRRIEEIRDKFESGKELTDKEEKLLDAPGVMLYCNKQRNGDWEGKAPLWFEQDSYRYRSFAKKNSFNQEVYVL